MKRQLRNLFLGTLCAPAFLWAQVKPFQQLKEVVVTDAKLSEESQTYLVTHIPDSLLLDSQPDLKSILRDQTNLYLREQGSGGVTTLFLRGTTSSQNAVVWNGININSQLNGMTDFNAVSAQNYNEVALRYGGGSIEYGSGAIGGTLHLNNKLRFEKGVHLKTQGTYGSFNTRSYTGQLNVASKAFALSLNANHYATDNDFEVAEFNYQNEDAALQNSDFSVNLGGNFNAHHSLRLYTNYYTGKRNFSSTTFGQNISGYRNENTRALLQHDFKKANVTSKTSLAHLYELYNYFPIAEQQDSFTFGKAQTWILKNESTYAFNKKTNLRAIAEYMNVQGEGSSIAQENFGQLATSLLLKYQISSRWFASAKLRYEIRDFETIDFAKALEETAGDVTNYQEQDNQAHNPLLYALALEYELAKDLKLSVNTSRNFRNPTINDRFWQGQGNPDLLPEYAKQYEIAAAYTRKKHLLRVAYYNMQSKDLITWAPNASGVWLPINVDAVRVYGIGLHLAPYIPLNADTRLNLKLSYDFTKTEDLSTGNALIYKPKHLLNFNLGILSRPFNVNIYSNYYSAVFTTTSNTRSLDPYHLWRVQLDRKFPLTKTASLRAVLRVHNVFNKAYLTSESYPGWGRNYHVSIQLNI